MLIVLANIATDRLVALHVFGFTPGRILLRCKLRPRSPGHRQGGPQLVCKISLQLGFDGGLPLSGVRNSILWTTVRLGGDRGSAAICAGTAAAAAAPAAAGTADPLLALAPPTLKRFLGSRAATHGSHV